MGRSAGKLRALLKAPGVLTAPGVADGVMARIVAREGFSAIYMTGAGTAATRLGWPDVGLMTMTEMADNAGRIAGASGLPTIADADTGYGGPLNVRRTVQCYESAGVAALHMEDQSWPKRCGHMAGKTLIPAEDMAAKIRAACDAREDPDFVVIARTDAIAVEGFDKALDRAKRYEQAGADVLFVEAPTSMEQLEAIPRAVSAPCLFNMAMSGKTPFLSVEEIEALGFKLAIYPNLMLMAAIPAATGALRRLKSEGSIKGMTNELTKFTDFFDLMGMPEVRELEERYQISEDARAGY
ncbi:2,3-dimethylmalate lyase [Albimonas donghaensis]|uniref:2-methylisocitrate lyase n=1 Tax=Albimonas donghaensis TaxID=356660 RepID=A0A1H3DQG6_9RHOB|nr:isocitrate lyase/PEP mutase family protein [Albimonas donghaensis]SDX68580.1 2,3-dimethylmalate lyase [Albimonas donghaensis]